MLFFVASAACGGSVLEKSYVLPHRVITAGFDKETQHTNPCPTWCRVDANVRMLTTEDGFAIAYEVKYLPSESDALERSVNTWGPATHEYTVEHDPAMDLQAGQAWKDSSRALHRRHLGSAAELLRFGDHRQTTRYGVWKAAGELVRVSSNARGVWIEWVDLSKLPSS